MNKVILTGNLARDPEIRYSQNENSLAIARFSIAVNRRFSRQGDTDTDFFNCTAFGKQAEFVEKYFKEKGRIEGRNEMLNAATSFTSTTRSPGATSCRPKVSPTPAVKEMPLRLIVSSPKFLSSM